MRTLLLLGAAALGAVLAATGLLEPNVAPVDEEAAAEVNGWVVPKADFLSLVERIAEEKKRPLSTDEHSDILERLIEEKLLLQRGLELGLAERDPKVRKAISDAMVQSIIADVSALEPEADDLETFFEENTAYFAIPARLRVQQILFKDQRDGKNDSKAAYQRALDAREALLAGTPLAEVEAQLADASVLQVPNTLLPPHKVRDYIGPGLLDLAMEMNTGSISTPQRTQNAYVLLLVLELERSQEVALDSIRDKVTREYQRRAGERALRDYLERLKSEADVRLMDLKTIS